MQNKETHIGSKITYLLIGSGIGAILALLFAPKSGIEFRTDIADATRSGLDRTGDIVDQIGHTAEGVYSDAAAAAGEVYDSVKNRISSGAAAIAEVPDSIQSTFQKKAESMRKH